MRYPVRRPSSTIAILLLIAHLGSTALPSLSFAQAGSSNVAKGQEYYEQSRFDEAIGLLKDLVDRGALQGDDLQHARELLARSYVKKGYPVQGKEMFKAILQANPQWRPDPIRVPPDETAVFEQALKEYTTESSGGTPPAPGETPPPATTPPATTTEPAAPAPSAPRPRPTPASALMPESAEGKKSNKKLWYIVGGVVLVGGIAAAAAGGGGGGGGSAAPTPLAGFPGPPGS
jgi:hypothetical protein